MLGRKILGTLLSSPSHRLTLSRTMASQYETLSVTQPREFVTQVQLNRPNKANAMNKAFWREMVECFNSLAVDADCRVIVLSAAGKTFTAGLDLSEMAEFANFSEEMDVSRRAFKLREIISTFQESFTCIEKCLKPVIVAVHGACIGGGVDMITACDIRYCSHDAFFQVKEVDIGLAADVGTLQRLPRVVGSDSLARELVYTARKMAADEARQCGLVSLVLPDRESCISAALDTAALIADKSPVAVQASKASLVYSRDHSVSEGLQHVASLNQVMLQSEDVMKSAMAMMTKQKPTFSKL